ncbi:MAG: DUF4157 domain-containing protein [Nevskia sp.]|nr:DUF4157 domain-containing protein [Nevskia sp.]
MPTFAPKQPPSHQPSAPGLPRRSAHTAPQSQAAPDATLAGEGRDFSGLPAQALQGSAGSPLGAAARASMGSLLGVTLPDVRIHRGATAEHAVSSLGVPAFTVGEDIFLGRGVNEATPRGERVLAHELAHAVQQSGAAHALGPLPRTTPGDRVERQAEAAARGLERPVPGMPLAIAAAPPDSLPFTPLKTFKQLWPEFDHARNEPNLAKARSLGKELVDAPYDFDDILNHGIELVQWLQFNGDRAAAATVLDKVRSVWMIQSVSKDAKLPPRGLASLSSNDPSTLISLGESEARAGHHEQAFLLFGTANELLSYYALQLTQDRSAKLADESAKEDQLRQSGNPADRAKLEATGYARMLERSSQYTDLGRIYDEMREIYGFYSVLEKESLAAGDAKGAAEARSRSDALHKEIKEKFTWGDTQKAGSITQEIHNPVEIAEVSYTDTPKGPGLTLHGANSAETDLTQLPGLPSPKEVGNNTQVQNLGALQDALMAQTDFQAEIGREPEIRKAFGQEPVDLNDTAKRQKVWQIMYGVYKKAGSGALGAVMALIGRYLKAYTIHTTYNVRDWGTSYLDSPMPTDLAGRAEKDCGVYALTVAWDVYETAKHADAKLDLGFNLTTMLEHVTLIIADKSAGEFYLVNNDFISPPQKGDPLAQVAPQYGAIRGLPYTVGPAMTMNLGPTKDPEKKFHDDAWTRYMASVDWGLRLDIPPDVQKLEKTNPDEYSRKVLAIQKTRYEKFYADQEAFDRGAKALDPKVDALAPLAGDAGRLAPELTKVVDEAGPLAALFVQIGPAVGVNAGSKKSQALLPQHAQYLFTNEPGHAVHPLARVGRAILHLQALGGTLTAKETAFVQFCDAVPQFKEQLDQYRTAGAQGAF